MNAPLITIAIPVYNGESYLSAAIECALGQTVQDFELVISDNGSVDRTREIAEAYARRDARICYTRFDVNQGPVKNFNRAFELAHGSYFKFSPHDDLYDPTYIERCIAWLEAHPDCVACNTPFAVIDEGGRMLKLSEVELHADQESVHERYYALLNNTKCYDFFSVIRKSALDLLPQPLLGAYAHADGVLLARLGMIGRIHHLPQALYFNRDHKDRSGNKYKTYREYTYFLDPAQRGRIVFPRWRMAREFFRTAGMFPMSTAERLRCYWLTARWCMWYWTSLAWNLADAAGMILRGEAFTNRSLN
jgi:glycosyltransferase involved in cell wall biosynthesis